MLGVLTVWMMIDTDLTADGEETTLVSVAQRASALTEYVPAPDQLWLAEVDEDQVEYEPSPQLKRYWTACPTVHVEPPVV